MNIRRGPARSALVSRSLPKGSPVLWATIGAVLLVSSPSMAEESVDAGAPPEGDQSPFIIPEGREAAVKSLFGDWWATPVQGVSIDGVSIDRNRLQVKLKSGLVEASLVVAHASDASPFAPGLVLVPSGVAFRAALSCPRCDAAERARFAKAVERWSTGAAAARDLVWVARPAPRATPEPGSIENIPQGKTPEETVFAAGEDPSSQTAAEPSTPEGRGDTATTPTEADPNAPATVGGQPAAAVAGGLAPPAAARPLGRYVLLAALIALLVWLLRAPPANEPAATVATPEAPEAAPSGGPASAPAVTADAVDAPAAVASEATDAEGSGAAATESPDGQSKPG